MKFDYSIQCSKDQLIKVRHFLEKKLEVPSMSAVEKKCMILAIDEACANAIIHGNKCDEKRNLKIEVELTTAAIEIEIYDIGCYDCPEDIQPVDLDQCIKNKQKGGLGLLLMHRIMDQVRFFSRGQVNVCALTKTLVKQP